MSESGAVELLERVVGICETFDARRSRLEESLGGGTDGRAVAALEKSVARTSRLARKCLTFHKTVAASVRS